MMSRFKSSFLLFCGHPDTRYSSIFLSRGRGQAHFLIGICCCITVFIGYIYDAVTIGI